MTETERDRDRDRERQRERETETETVTETDRDRDRDRQTHTYTHRHTQTHTHAHNAAPERKRFGEGDKLVAKLLGEEGKVVNVPAAALNKLELPRRVVLWVEVQVTPVRRVGVEEIEVWPHGIGVEVARVNQQPVKVAVVHKQLHLHTA